MSDIEINLGYIDGDIVALCDDAEANYAFHAVLKGHRYLARMASSHGVVTKSTFHEDVGTRQMIMSAMANHLDVVAEMESGSIQLMETIPTQTH